MVPLLPLFLLACSGPMTPERIEISEPAPEVDPDPSPLQLVDVSWRNTEFNLHGPAEVRDQGRCQLRGEDWACTRWGTRPGVGPDLDDDSIWTTWTAADQILPQLVDHFEANPPDRDGREPDGRWLILTSTEKKRLTTYWEHGVEAELYDAVAKSTEAEVHFPKAVGQLGVSVYMWETWYFADGDLSVMPPELRCKPMKLAYTSLESTLDPTVKGAAENIGPYRVEVVSASQCRHPYQPPAIKVTKTSQPLERAGESNTGTVSAGDPIVYGALDKSQIIAVLRKQEHKFLYCYQRELVTRDGTLTGGLRLSFTISSDGSMAHSEITASSLNNPTAEACLNEMMMSVRFPEPEDGGTVRVEYPLEFKIE